MVASCSVSEKRPKLMAVTSRTRQAEPSLRTTMSFKISSMSRKSWVEGVGDWVLAGETGI